MALSRAAKVSSTARMFAKGLIGGGPAAPLGPTTASFTAGATSGSLITAITGLSSGETIASVSPNDGRVAISSGSALVVGLTASAAGTISYTLTTSTGRSLTIAVTANAGNAGPTVTVTQFDTLPAAYTVQYPSSQSAAGWIAAADLDGGLPVTTGAVTRLYSQSTTGASASWSTGAGLTASTQRFTVTHTGQDFVFRCSDDGQGQPLYWRILVNGVYAAGGSVSTGGVSARNRFNVMDFGSVATRDITIECNSSISPIVLWRRSADTLAKPAYNKKTRLIVGDSIPFGGLNSIVTGTSRVAYLARIDNGTAGQAGNTMTVTSISGGGPLAVGQNVISSTATPGTKITAQQSGTPGGVGIYTVDITQSAAVATATNGEMYFNGDSVTRRMCDLQGVRAITNAIPGSGYAVGVNANNYVNNRLVSGTRQDGTANGGGDLAALMPLVDDAVFMAGSNDTSSIANGTLTLANFQSAVNYIANYMAVNFPTKPVLFTDGFYKFSASAAQNANTSSAIQAAVAAAKSANPSARIGFLSIQGLQSASQFNTDLTHPHSAGEAALAAAFNTPIANALAAL